MQTYRGMSKAQVQSDWAGFMKEHNAAKARRIAKYCKGNKITDVAEWIGYGVDYVRSQLTVAGISRGAGTVATPRKNGSEVQTHSDGGCGRITADGQQGFDRAAAHLMKKHKPDVEVVRTKDPDGTRHIAKVTGKDAREYKEVVQDLQVEGFNLDAAERIAAAEIAAKKAVKAGDIKSEVVEKTGEEVKRILFPQSDADIFVRRLKTHILNVKNAARFLDDAKINLLRRPDVAELVEEADEVWRHQADRVENLKGSRGRREVN